MQVTSSTSAERTVAAAAASTGSDAATTVAKKAVLGQEDFLKLLSVQFQQQDPMKPMEDTAFIAQMAQFTALDQSSSMLKQITQLGSSQIVATANSYLGRQVTLNGADDQLVTGVVTGVRMSSGVPELIVDGSAYPVESVMLVQPAPLPSDSNATNP